MNKSEQINLAEEVFYKTYNRYPVIFESGKGVNLYDSEGNEYLDFGAGIAVMGLGYGHEKFQKSLHSQIDKLIHTTNLFYNKPAIEAGEKLIKAGKMEKVFFTNSGTEAIEGAIKIAKTYAHSKDMGEDYEIISMDNSFHGRSLGALSVTGNTKYQKSFTPLIPNIKFATFNDLDSVKKLVSKKTCAIILETVQGEGGIYVGKEEFLVGIQEICNENDILLILDEIQCGMGRCGTMFAWQDYPIEPDVVTTAKALGNGVPIGAFMAKGKAAKAMVPGDHGTTYGGNPMVCATALAVLNIFEEEKILDNVNKMGEYLWKKLDELKEKHSSIIEHRGKGLMQGLEFNVPVAPIINNALLNENLVLIGTGEKIIRFVPPLIINSNHVDIMIEKLDKAIK